MVWGAISAKGVSQLKMVSTNLNSKNYQDLIINDIKTQCECIIYPDKDYVFQQDNAPCHNSASTRAFLQNHNIPLLDWPSNSPDLSPIETVWNIIKRKMSVSPKTKQDLWEDVQRLWYSTTKDVLQPLYESMPGRIKAVIKAKGDVTRF